MFEGLETELVIAEVGYSTGSTLAANHCPKSAVRSDVTKRP